MVVNACRGQTQVFLKAQRPRVKELGRSAGRVGGKWSGQPEGAWGALTLFLASFSCSSSSEKLKLDTVMKSLMTGTNLSLGSRTWRFW